MEYGFLGMALVPIPLTIQAHEWNRNETIEAAIKLARVDLRIVVIVLLHQECSKSGFGGLQRSKLFHTN